MVAIRYVKKGEKDLKKILDSIEYQNSWRRRMKWNFPHNMNEEKALFVARCMSENLSHARHVENERITFNSVFMAMTAGAMTFASVNKNNHFVAGCLIVGMIFACFIAWTLTTRWSNAFDRHLHYAKECYIILHKYYFQPFNKKLRVGKRFRKAQKGFKVLEPIREEPFSPNERAKRKFIREQAIKEKVKGIKDYPLYCFNIRNPVIKVKRFEKVFLMNTKRLYNLFYLAVLVMLIFSVIYCFSNINWKLILG